MSKTYSQKPKEITRKWYLLDAQEISLGRLSTKASALLVGKTKPSYSPHIDGGDFVVIINSDLLRVTGDKLQKKTYYRHTGYPGGLKEMTLEKAIAKDSTKVIEASIKGMLPVNKLRDGRLKRLKIYPGSEHNHTAQSPTKIVTEDEAK